MTGALLYSQVLFRLEHVFADSARGARPIVWQIFKRCAWSYSVVRIADLRIIDVTANRTYVLFHAKNLPH